MADRTMLSLAETADRISVLADQAEDLVSSINQFLGSYQAPEIGDLKQAYRKARAVQKLLVTASNNVENHDG